MILSRPRTAGHRVRESSGSIGCWCPFDIAQRFDSEEVFSAKRQARVGEAALEASLNAAERDALKAFSKPSSPKKKTSKVVSIDKKKSLADQLKEDAAWFDETL